MAFDDDDDDINSASAPARTAQSTEDAPDAEDALEDEAQDFRHFAGLQRRKNISSSTIRKGEKDFESHGTKAQADALEQSRQAMETVLSFTRTHKGNSWARGWYFPDRWEHAEDVVDFPDNPTKTAIVAAERREMHAKDRVVAVVGGDFNTAGRVIKSQGKQTPGWDGVWLLPEEALFLIERGSLDLWWPTKPMSEVFPVGEEHGEDGSVAPDAEEEDEYELGLPLSLQAAYSLLIGNEGERGKVSLRHFQVYANLSRVGYHVLRVPPPPAPEAEALIVTSQQTPLWQRLFSLFFSERRVKRPAYGPLVQPGLHRTYASIYKQLEVIPRHKPSTQPASTIPPQGPFHIFYHVWKAGVTGWSKAKPPGPPDLYIAVVDAQDTSVPTCEEITALLDSAPHDPPKAQWQVDNMLYPRLKYGHRNVLLAVVDHGLVNFLRFGDGAFGEELLYKRFDNGKGPRGGVKRGGRGGKRDGRGGRGGRGRGGGGRGRGG